MLLFNIQWSKKGIALPRFLIHVSDFIHLALNQCKAQCWNLNGCIFVGFFFWLCFVTHEHLFTWGMCIRMGPSVRMMIHNVYLVWFSHSDYTILDHQFLSLRVHLWQKMIPPEGKGSSLVQLFGVEHFLVEKKIRMNRFSLLWKTSISYERSTKAGLPPNLENKIWARNSLVAHADPKFRKLLTFAIPITVLTFWR